MDSASTPNSAATPNSAVADFIDEVRDTRDQIYASRPLMLEYVLKNSRPGDIQNIINTIDDFARTQQWLMNIGDKKGEILDHTLRSKGPKTVLELGTFLGYSSLRIASQTADDALIVSIEINAQSADIAKRIHQHAGVGNRIHVVVDASDKAIPRLRDQFKIDAFDFIFIDHFKDLYLSDLKLLEQERLIKTGTTILADNVICPGAPDYLEYVRNNPQYSSVFHEGTIEYRDDVPDGVEVSIRL